MCVCVCVCVCAWCLRWVTSVPPASWIIYSIYGLTSDPPGRSQPSDWMPVHLMRDFREAASHHALYFLVNFITFVVFCSCYSPAIWYYAKCHSFIPMVVYSEPGSLNFPSSWLKVISTGTHPEVRVPANCCVVKKKKKKYTRVMPESEAVVFRYKLWVWTYLILNVLQINPVGAKQLPVYRCLNRTMISSNIQHSESMIFLSFYPIVNK